MNISIILHVPVVNLGQGIEVGTGMVRLMISPIGMVIYLSIAFCRLLTT